jgi:hypothetical protein
VLICRQKRTEIARFAENHPPGMPDDACLGPLFSTAAGGMSSDANAQAQCAPNSLIRNLMQLGLVQPAMATTRHSM